MAIEYRDPSGSITEVSPTTPLPVSAPISYVGAHVSGTLGAAVTTLTAPAGADALLIQVMGANARCKLDGAGPDASHGFRLTDGRDPLLIAVAGVGATVKLYAESGAPTYEAQWVGG